MTATASAPTPATVDRVERARAAGDMVRLKLTGRRLRAWRADEGDPLLVVTVDGRRHRFTTDRGEDPAEGGSGDRWRATFTIPSWAEPRLDGQAALWIGDCAVAIGPVSGSKRPLPIAAPAAEAAPAAPEVAVAAAPVAAPAAPAAPEVAVAAAPVAAVAAPAVPFPAAPAPTPPPAPPPSTGHDELEATQRQLRAELDQLTAAVDAQRDELQRRLAETRGRLAEVESDRDRLRAERDEARQAAESERARLAQELVSLRIAGGASSGEVAGLRAELERLATELAVAREQLAAQGGDLGEAQRLLADARALTSRLREQNPQ